MGEEWKAEVGGAEGVAWVFNTHGQREGAEQLPSPVGSAGPVSDRVVGVERNGEAAGTEGVA